MFRGKGEAVLVQGGGEREGGRLLCRIFFGGDFQTVPLPVEVTARRTSGSGAVLPWFSSCFAAAPRSCQLSLSPALAASLEALAELVTEG